MRNVGSAYILLEANMQIHSLALSHTSISVVFAIVATYRPINFSANARF